METSEIIAKKSNRPKIAEVMQIVIGGILSLCVIVLIIIFHKFVSGYISPVDILLLLLFLTGKLFISGCKSLRNNCRMPPIMLTYADGKFTVLQDTVFPEQIKMVKKVNEHGNTGRLIITLENKKYTLYGVCECRKAALRIVDILAERGIEPFKGAKEKYGKKSD